MVAPEKGKLMWFRRFTGMEIQEAYFEQVAYRNAPEDEVLEKESECQK